MKRFLKQLFHPTRPISRPRTNLGVESMENRLTPAVTVDSVSRVMTITPDAYGYTDANVTGTPDGGVSYGGRTYPGWISAIEINGGPYGDLIRVSDIPGGIPVKISASDGQDRVILERNRSPVDVYTGSGNDVVEVRSCWNQTSICNTGDRDTVRVGDNGSMHGILGPVSVSNDACSMRASSTDLELDNRSGSRPSSGYGQNGNVDIGSGEVKGLALGSIFYGANTSLSVWTSRDQRSVSITDTGGTGVTVNLAQDHRDQTVYVGGTTSPLRINNYGQGNKVWFGSLQSIRGPVSVYGNYSYYTDLEFRGGVPAPGLITWYGLVRVISY